MSDGLPLDAPPGSVALVLLSAIGDVVHGMPVVASLRRAWPEARIDWVIQPGPHALVAGHPDVSRFLLFERDRGLREFLDFRSMVRGRPYGLVVDLQVYFKAGVLTALLDAPVKLGFDRARARDLNWLFTTHRVPARGVRHVQEQYFEFLEEAGVPVVERWDFAFTDGERRAAGEFFGRLERPALAVVLATTKPEKNWLPERYARVLEVAAREHGLRPVLVGGESPAEEAAARAVMERCGAEVLDARADDLRRLAWLLDGAALALSPDTGPLHLASALGTPVVGLYGYTDPRRTGPYREAFRELVVDAWREPGDDPERASAETRPGRMERITVEAVAGKLALAAERYL